MKPANELLTSKPVDATGTSRRNLDASQTGIISVQPDVGFNAVFDSSGEALLVVDPTGVIERSNQRARELLRITNPRLRPVSLSAYLSRIPEPFPEILADGKLSRSLDVSLATGFPIRISLRSILPGSNHLLLCLEDGSLVQRAEAKWRQLDAELKSVLESIPEGVILCDASGRVRFSNIRFGQLFSLDARTLEKLESFSDLEELLEGRFRTAGSFCARWQRFQTGDGEPGHDELEIMRPSLRVMARFSRPVLDTEGRSVGWLEIYSDVTGERQVQSSLLQTEKAAALGQLVSGIAHELNNPLTTIMGYAQLLLGHGLMPAQLVEARKVYQEAERACHIVKNLLYFARENKPERTLVDLNELIERTLALRSYELKVENITVTCELAANLPRTMADPYQLQQVLLNLIVNAEQALLEDRGQGNIRIRTSGSSPRSGEWLSVEIMDDGPGIAPDVASRIFDPFFTTKAPGVGTGLGLSIAYGIVQQHSGEITVGSQPGVGTRFLIELPVTSLSSQGNRISAGAGIQPPAAPPSCILVVEDEPTVAQLIVDVLSEEGHQVEAALDSQDGLTRISRCEYDLIVCDLRMPRLD
jgi:signal transduction histidine kinase